MKLLNDYFKLQQEIYNYFGYKENWRVIPLDDCTEYYWYLTGEGEGDNICFASSEQELQDEDDEYYEEEIYPQRYLEKWVYRGLDYTMVVVDTQTDGNKLLSIFDNKKERNYES